MIVFHSTVELQDLHNRNSHIFGVLTEKLSSLPVYNEHRCCNRLFPHTNKKAIPWFRVKDVICFLLTQTMPRLSTLFEGRRQGPRKDKHVKPDANHSTLRWHHIWPLRVFLVVLLKQVNFSCLHGSQSVTSASWETYFRCLARIQLLCLIDGDFR